MVKIRKQKMELVRIDTADGDRWVLCERIRTKDLGDGRFEKKFEGTVFDVTDSVRPALNGSNMYIKRIENAILLCIKYAYRTKLGRYPTDDEVNKILQWFGQREMRAEKRFGCRKS